MKVHKTGKERLFEMFENVNKTKVVEKKLIIKENKKVLNKWGKVVKPSRITESILKEDKFYDHILQGDEATEENAYNHARGLDWQSVETQETSFPDLRYIDTVNGVGIYYHVPVDAYYFTDENDTMGESFDNPVEKDHKYLNKGNITDVLKQTKPDDGTRYPVEDKFKVKDPSLEKMKGDDAPIVPEGGNDQEVADQNSEKSDDELQIDAPVPNIGGEATPEEPEMGDVSIDLDSEAPEEPEIDDVSDLDGGTPEMGSVEISTPDQIEGGLGDEASVSDNDSDQIANGIKVEMEHTNDPKIALEIVLDHLVEDPMYYGEGGADPEAAAMAGAQDDVHASSTGGEMPEPEGMGGMMGGPQAADPNGVDMQAMMGGTEPEGEGEQGDLPMSIVNAIGMGGEEPEGEGEPSEKDVLFGKLDTVGEMGTDDELEDLDFKFEPKNVGEDFDFAGQERDYYDKQDNDDSMARYQELTSKGPAGLRPEEHDELKQLELQMGIDPMQKGGMSSDAQMPAGV